MSTREMNRAAYHTNMNYCIILEFKYPKEHHAGSRQNGRNRNQQPRRTEKKTHHVNMPNINDAPLHILQHHQIVLLVKNTLYKKK